MKLATGEATSDLFAGSNGGIGGGFAELQHGRGREGPGQSVSDRVSKDCPSRLRVSPLQRRILFAIVRVASGNGVIDVQCIGHEFRKRAQFRNIVN